MSVHYFHLRLLYVGLIALCVLFLFLTPLGVCLISNSLEASDIGKELSVPNHLQDGQEFRIPLKDLLAHGKLVFAANWTIQEGAGRPLTKGTGARLTDTKSPLRFPRNFNRISAPDANSCAGCHNTPFAITGGGGDIVANVFVLGQRFDFVTFDPKQKRPITGAVDEIGSIATPETIGNSRATIGMFGSGFIEMLARQMTEELQKNRDKVKPGESKPLVAKGVSFGFISRFADGTWDTSKVEGLPALSFVSTGPSDPPTLAIRPFHQVGNVVSLRQFSNNAFNHHHGIQSTERFGLGSDPDGDDVVNELTRADVTAVTAFQATMAVPGRVIPNDNEIEAAVLRGEKQFKAIGCASCHVPQLPLNEEGWIFTEPSPHNPKGELRPGMVQILRIDLTSSELPSPRLKLQDKIVWVPAFTDLKLHDITDGPEDPNREVLDMNQPAGSPNFFVGNGKFLTRKLWGCANEPPYFHHGKFTTLRESVLAHGGEAKSSADAFRNLSEYDQDCLIEFLKTLQVLPPGTKDRIVDENGKRRKWTSEN